VKAAQSGLSTRIAVTESVLVVRAEELLTVFLELEGRFVSAC
jgi:hypothetical protein